jgi:hypothetical protein
MIDRVRCLQADLLARPPCTQLNPKPTQPTNHQRHPRLNEGRGKGGLGVPPVTSVEPVERADLWTYQFGKKRRYLKVTVAMPNLVTAAKGALEDCSIRIGGDPNGLRLQVGAWR